MSAPCDLVTECIALGEPLGELRDHAATCARCQRLLSMPTRIAAATERPDPGLGFSARMTIGAQHKLVVRRRRRVAATAGVSVAAAALAVFALTRPAAPVTATQEPDPALEVKPPPRVIETPVVVGDSELVELVNFADTRRATRASAPWGRIRKPLRPYIQLVKGVAP